MSNKKKEHKVQVIFKDARYIAVEHQGTITFTRDGAPAGQAKWINEQFLENSAILPDEVIREMEKKIKEALAADYFD